MRNIAPVGSVRKEWRLEVRKKLRRRHNFFAVREFLDESVVDRIFVRRIRFLKLRKLLSFRVRLRIGG